MLILASQHPRVATPGRQRLVATARRLFVQQSSTATRMAAIADAAGVSLETLYAAFGPKPKLVRHLVETAISGAEVPVPPLDRPWVCEILAERNPRRKVDAFAAGVRQMLERVAPLWAGINAAADDPPSCTRWWRN